MASKTPDTTGPTGLHYAVLIAAQLAVGSAAVLARAGLDDGLGPISLSAWRLTLAASALLVFGIAYRPTGRSPNVTTRDRDLLIGAGILLGLHFATWFASLQRIPVARSTLLVCTSPVFTGLIAVAILRQRIPGRFWWGLLIAAVGIWGITRPMQTVAGSELPWIGDLLALAGALTIALYLLIAERLQTRIGSLRLITWTYTAAALTLWPAALAAESGRIVPASVKGWGSILAMALIPQLIGHSAMNWSLKHFTASIVGAATLLEPVFAAALAWWLFHESITPLQAAGAAILLAGVALAITARRSNGVVE